MADYVTSEELQEELEKLSDELGISVAELLEVVNGDITTNSDAIASLKEVVAGNTAAITAITEMDDNGVQSLAEKIKALNDMFSEDGELVTDILNKIATNKAETEANAAATGVVATDLSDYIEANDATQESQNNRMGTIETDASKLADKVADLEEASSEATDGLSDRVTVNEGDLEILKGDVETEGSVDYKVEAEAARAKNVSGKLADLVTDDKSTLVGAINEVQSERDATQADVEGAKTRITVTEGDIATLNGDNTVDGSVAKSVKDSADSVTAATDTKIAGVQGQLDLINADVETEGSVDYKIAENAKQSNEVTDALEVKIADNKALAEEALEAAKEATDEAVSGLSDRIAVNENTLLDTTDADDNLVKGIVTRMGDAEASVVTELDRATAVEADLQAQLDEVSSATSGLLSGVICGRKAVNKFRARVGQDAKDFECGSDDDGDGEAI